MPMESSQHTLEMEERCQAGPADLQTEAPQYWHPGMDFLKSALNLGPVTSEKGKETFTFLPVAEM